MVRFAVLGCKVKISEEQSGHGRGEDHCHEVLWDVEPIFSLLGEEPWKEWSRKQEETQVTPLMETRSWEPSVMANAAKKWREGVMRTG